MLLRTVTYRFLCASVFIAPGRVSGSGMDGTVVILCFTFWEAAAGTVSRSSCAVSYIRACKVRGLRSPHGPASLRHGRSDVWFEPLCLRVHCPEGQWPWASLHGLPQPCLDLLWERVSFSLLPVLKSGLFVFVLSCEGSLRVATSPLSDIRIASISCHSVGCLSLSLCVLWSPKVFVLLKFTLAISFITYAPGVMV